VKGPSLFSQLRLYQPLESTNIDYMHTLLEGVVKRLFGIWFSKTGALARSKLELLLFHKEISVHGITKKSTNQQMRGN